ncbi:hypothetical protein N0V94_006455 [Neodidymelliopsis sp. IMI 364377]|nr:hypothetical protein N0V94_006455 [Neodidymelliopsis sp. IMI 364377]
MVLNITQYLLMSSTFDEAKLRILLVWERVPVEGDDVEVEYLLEAFSVEIEVHFPGHVDDAEVLVGSGRIRKEVIFMIVVFSGPSSRKRYLRILCNTEAYLSKHES